MRATVFGALVGGDAGAGLGPVGRAAVTLLAFMVATVIWALARSHGVLGAAAFYFPATLIATLFAGWPFGLAVLAASTALIYFLPHPLIPAGPIAAFELAGLLQIALAGLVRALLRESWRAELQSRRLVEQHEREADTREMVLGEARHRLKNLFAIIDALAKYSGPRPGSDPALDSFMQRFTGRLRALGAASDLVLKQRLEAVEAKALVGAVLEPFLSEQPQRLSFDGPELELSEQFGGALALAVHELATNALKYGALSVPAGSASFHWTVTPEEAGERIAFHWKENGGPAPSPPDRDGFGHRMIRAVAQRETEGEVVIDYPPEGLLCRISFLRRSTVIPSASSSPAPWARGNERNY